MKYPQHKIKIGVAPVKRAFFGAKAVAEQEAVDFLNKINEIKGEAVEIVDIVDLIPGTDRIAKGVAGDDMGHIDLVVNKFKAAGIDGLFLPHANFGNEEVTARIAAALNVPTLIWGNRDPDPEKFGRPRDTQCGIFALTKVLQRFNVPFSYIINVDTNDPIFEKGFKEFCSTVSIIKTFRGMKIAQISTRPRPFMSVIYDEGDLLSRWGIQVIPVSMTQLINNVNKMVETNDPQFLEAYEDITKRFKLEGFGMNFPGMPKVEPEDAIKKMCALKPALYNMLTEVGATAAASECWVYGGLIGTGACAMFGEMSDLGLPVACETDVMGAITTALAQAAALGEKTTFFADLTIRHPYNDNAELLWHCGPYAYSLAKKDVQPAIANGRAQFEIEGGPITVSRLDGVKGNYKYFIGEGKGVEGPKTTGTYVWFEADDWTRWEEALMFGPYIHHCTGVHGNYGRAMIEAAKYIPTLEVDAMMDYRPSLGL